MGVSQYEISIPNKLPNCESAKFKNQPNPGSDFVIVRKSKRADVYLYTKLHVT